MIADSSLSSAFDDLADLFLGGGMDGGTPSNPIPNGVSNGKHGASDGPVRPSGESKPMLVEGLVLGHLPMMASLWASQYPRMTAAQDNAPVALVRLDAGMARVELFHPPSDESGRTRLGSVRNGDANGHGLPERPCPDLAGALSRAAQVASRVVIFSSFAADELLFARSPSVSAMAVLTGADDASAVGAYKAIKRLAGGGGDKQTRLIRVAVMGSEERKANAAFHRLSDAAGSFLSMPIQLAGHCRQIAGGVPGTILFEGASAMTTQAVLESLARPGAVETKQPEWAVAAPKPETLALSSVCDAVTLPAAPTAPVAAATDSLAYALGSDRAVPVRAESVEVAAIALPMTTAVAPLPPPTPPPVALPVGPAAPLLQSSTPAGLTPLPIRCPFDRNPMLAIDGGGVPQVIVTADAGYSADAIQRLLSVAAWLSASRELLGMVCPTLRTDAQPVLHLVTDRPVDVKRLIDSDLRLHVRLPASGETATLPLN
jgi:hypothetical protein